MHACMQDDDDAADPDQLLDRTNSAAGAGAAQRKALRSDDPTFKSAEQLR